MCIERNIDRDILRKMYIEKKRYIKNENVKNFRIIKLYNIIYFKTDMAIWHSIFIAPSVHLLDVFRHGDLSYHVSFYAACCG
jgi:hypothetical protein